MSDQKKLVIISSLVNEAITYSISTMKGINHHIISLDDFLNSVQIFDEIDEHGTTIHWKKDDVIIQNDNHTLILSRLFYNSIEALNAFNSKDKDYASAEIQAYLGFAMNSFITLNYQLDDNGHEILHPLPTQWEFIKNINHTYRVPDYYWGDYRFNHLQGNDLVYSEICNFKKWRNTTVSHDKMIFCFKKPPGNPYFSLVINGSALITPGSSQSNPSHLIDIYERSILLAKQFKYFISESLYFHDGEKITIACISPLVLYSKKNNQFTNFVHQQFHKAL